MLIFDEFSKYTEKYARDAVASAGGVWSSSGNIDLFWNSMGDKLPNLAVLALKYKDAICNSADAERSNSLYNLVVSERRWSLNEKTIKSLLFLYHNNHLLL